MLAYFYSRDILTPQQAYFYVLNALDRFKKEGVGSQAQVSAQLRLAEESLLALGMGEAQIKEIARTRQASRDIEIRAPVSGLVLQRNIYPNLRFDRGTEWYWIADISWIWILADIFENEAHYFGLGVHAKVTLPYQQKMLHAMVSDTPPQFDPTTRTLKVRLEMDNPGLALRPDMFVDVEFPVNLPSTLNVPVDAILDSGLKKTVFVDRGNGFFEPRQVETGWRMGDRVEIVKGLMPGERIVTSSTFLLDSESRMRLAAAGMSAKAEARVAKDPVCGMDVDENKAKAAGLMAEHRGKAYYFCMDECKQAFGKDPVRYVEKSAASGKPGVTPIAAQTEQRAKDPICGMEVVVSVASKAARVSEYHGKKYYFCADECKQQFDRDPNRYVEKTSGSGNPAVTPGQTEQQARDPACGKNVVISVAAKPTTMSEYRGKAYYFCCPHCKARFDKDPDRYI